MPVEPSVHMVTFRRVYMQRLERGSCMQVKISKEACALGDNWNEWGELSWSSLTAKKTKTSSSQIQIIGHLWGLLFVRVGIVQSVSLSFYRLCLGTVIRARGGDRKEKKKHWIWWVYPRGTHLHPQLDHFPWPCPVTSALPQHYVICFRLRLDSPDHPQSFKQAVRE